MQENLLGGDPKSTGPGLIWPGLIFYHKNYSDRIKVMIKEKTILFYKNFRQRCKKIFGNQIFRLFIFRVPNIIFLNHLKSNFVIIDEIKYHLDPKDNHFLSVNKIYEPQVTKTMKEIIKLGDWVIDIGANIGYYTLLLAKLVGPKGKVISFEPDPTSFKILKKNIKANNFKNIVPENKAIADKNREINFYISKKDTRFHQIFDNPDNKKILRIRAITLDQYLKKFSGRIDFVKIDIEGAEPLALQGMEKTIKKNRNIKIITEYAPNHLKLSGYDGGKYLKNLADLNFKFYDLDQIKEKNIYLSKKKILAKYPDNNSSWTNLLCLKNRTRKSKMD